MAKSPPHFPPFFLVVLAVGLVAFSLTGIRQRSQPQGPGPSLAASSCFNKLDRGLPVAFDEGVTAYLEYRVPGDYPDIEAAIAAAREADQSVAIRLKGSIYGPFAIRYQGTKTRFLKIVGEGPDRTKVAGRGDQTILIDKAQYVVLENLRVEGNGGYAVHIVGEGSKTTGCITLRRLGVTTTESYEDCVKVTNTAGVYVDTSHFNRCSDRQGGAAIDMVCVRGGFVTRSRFEQSRGKGLQAKGGAQDILIHGNTFEKLDSSAVTLGGDTRRAPCYQGNGRPEGTRILAMANKLIETSRANSPQASFQFEHCRDCAVVNNTLVRPGRIIFRSVKSTPGEKIKNNLIIEHQGEVEVSVPTEIDYNYWYYDFPKNYKPRANDVARVAPELDQDYRPLTDSETNHRGIPFPGLILDFDRRPFDPEEPTIGAYECS